MPLFAGFLVFLLAVMAVRRHEAAGIPIHTAADRKVAIVEMNLLATALLERDQPSLQPRFRVTDFQVRSFIDQHPDLFRNRTFPEAKEDAAILATSEHHDQIMQAYLEAARRQVDFQEGPSLRQGPKAAEASDDRVLARIGGRSVVEADFQAFLAFSLDDSQRHQFAATPGAREHYLKRFLDYEILAAKARLEGVR